MEQVAFIYLGVSACACVLCMCNNNQTNKGHKFVNLRETDRQAERECMGRVGGRKRKGEW